MVHQCPPRSALRRVAPTHPKSPQRAIKDKGRASGGPPTANATAPRGPSPPLQMSRLAQIRSYTARPAFVRDHELQKREISGRKRVFAIPWVQIRPGIIRCGESRQPFLKNKWSRQSSGRARKKAVAASRIFWTPPDFFPSYFVGSIHLEWKTFSHRGGSHCRRML